jgi:flagellar basal-body rod protein FlgC
VAGDANSSFGSDGTTDMGVSVAGTVQSNATPQQKYDPGNPYADANGYVTGSNVSQADEMVNLIDSSNSYAASVAVLQQASRIDQQMLSSFQVS